MLTLLVIFLETVEPILKKFTLNVVYDKAFKLVSNLICISKNLSDSGYFKNLDLMKY